MIDLLVRDALVVDGTGAAPRHADVAVAGGRIVGVGRRLEGPAQRTIDAAGLALMPGIVDSHTHFDAQINWDPLGTSACWQGVTSVVMGNCGFTLAPSRAENRGWVVRNLERAEDISAAAMAQGITWGWQTFPE